MAQVSGSGTAALRLNARSPGRTKVAPTGRDAWKEVPEVLAAGLQEKNG